MNKITKKAISILTTFIFLVSISVISVFAVPSQTMSINFRIEGINSNMFYKTISVPYNTSMLTLQAALKYIDEQESSIVITGVDAAYITDINGDTAGKFGGWDGWLFTVNGVEVSAGIDGCILHDNDSVVLYYGDPYGVGMQYPVADTSKIADGIIKFTSSDTTYDANYNPTVTVNPVAGATVTWNYENASATYTTDANGEIKIDSAQLTAGSHTVQIAKTSSTGLPLVLRCTPDYSVNVAATTIKTETNENQSILNNTENNTTVTIDSNPQTGEKNKTAIFFIIIPIAVVAIVATIVLKRKNTNDK